MLVNIFLDKEIKEIELIFIKTRLYYVKYKVNESMKMTSKY